MEEVAEVGYGGGGFPGEVLGAVVEAGVEIAQVVGEEGVAGGGGDVGGGVDFAEPEGGAAVEAVDHGFLEEAFGGDQDGGFFADAEVGGCFAHDAIAIVVFRVTRVVGALRVFIVVALVALVALSVGDLVVVVLVVVIVLVGVTPSVWLTWGFGGGVRVAPGHDGVAAVVVGEDHRERAADEFAGAQADFGADEDLFFAGFEGFAEGGETAGGATCEGVAEVAGDAVGVGDGPAPRLGDRVVGAGGDRGYREDVDIAGSRARAQAGRREGLQAGAEFGEILDEDRIFQAFPQEALRLEAVAAAAEDDAAAGFAAARG